LGKEAACVGFSFSFSHFTIQGVWEFGVLFCHFLRKEAYGFQTFSSGLEMEAH
jgi:hypothetical protein